MGIFNKLIPTYTYNKNGTLISRPIPEEVYIDDAFDPLFNRRAREYLNYKYGNPILGTLGGFAEGVDNAIFGQKDKWGILGPGMGILSGFGRTMDKAGDFIIGGLTEGVNALNYINPLGANVKPENPLTNIFVEDEDYTGKRLLAAMGNSMSKLTGNTVLDESDFTGLWNLPATGLELATDPGLLGGGLAKKFAPELANISSTQILKNIGKAPVKHTVGEIGQLLSNYDDLMAKVSWDTTMPGLRPLLKNTLGKLNELVGIATSKVYEDTILEQYDNIAKQGPDTVSPPRNHRPGKNITGASSTQWTNMGPSANVKTTAGVAFKKLKPSERVDPVAFKQELSSQLKQLKQLDTNLELYESMIDNIALQFKITSETEPELYNLIIDAKKKLNGLKELPVETDLDNYVASLKTKMKNYFKDREIRYNTEMENALTNTEAGIALKLGSHYADDAGDSLIEFHKRHREDALDIIKSFEVFSEIDETAKKAYKAQGLGPGYDFNLNYYRKENGSINTDKFIKDLSDGLVKDEDGVEVDDAILNYMYNKFEKAMGAKGFSTPNVKIFYSPTGRKNDVRYAATFVNRRFKAFTKKYFRKDFVTADEFMNKFKSHPHVQEMFKSYPKLEGLLQKQIENILSPRYLNKRGDLSYHTLPTYFKNIDEFATTIRTSNKFVGYASMEGTPFFRDLFNMLDEVSKDVLEPLTLIDKTVGEPRQYLSYLGDLNNIIGRNPNAFLNEVTKEFDLNKFEKFRMALPSFDVKIMPKVTAQIYSSDKAKVYFDALEDSLNKFKEASEYANLKQFRKAYASTKKKAARADLIKALQKEHPEYKTAYFTKEYNSLKKQLETNNSSLSKLFKEYKALQKDPSKSNLLPDIELKLQNLLKETVELDRIKTAYGYVVKDWNDILLGKESVDDALKRLKIAKTGRFSGNEILRFTTEPFRPTPELNKLNAKFVIDQSKLYKNTFNDMYKYLNKQAFAKEMVDTTPISTYIYDNVTLNVIGDLDELSKIYGSPEDAVRTLGTPQQKRWFSLIDLAKSVKKKAMGGDYATLREKRVSALVDKFTETKKKYSDIDVANYFRMRDMLNEDIVKGDNFISELISSNGRILIPINKKKNAAKIKSLTDAINHNILATSIDGQPIAQLVSKEVKGTDYVILGYKVVEDTGVTKRFAKLKNIKGLKDLKFHKAEGIDVSQYADLDDLFNEAQGITEEFSKTLGFTNFSSDYFKHVMSDDVKGGEWLNKNIYNDIDIDNLDELSSVLASMLNNNGTFRIQPATRSLRGNFVDWNQFAPIFSTDLEAISKSTFSKGIFDNVNFQSYVDLFVNDNFKISSYAKTPEDLKKILYAGYDKGNTGNLDNTLLVAPVYDANGKLTKFKRYDKYSDNGLAEALKNPDTILIPTSVLTPLDKIIRKDAKMSNKAFRFFNKYLNIPFKFGTLMNPGFLAGNLSDAYFKQAVTLSNKYGTSLSKELANVAASLKQVYLLNNEFDDVYRRKFLKTYAPEVLEKRKFLNISDIIIKNKKINQEFRDWFKNAVVKNELSEKEESTIRLWMFLNDTQTSSTFKASSTDLGDLTEVVKKSNYEIPTSPVERVLTGSGKYNSKDIKTWGIFANNPISNSVIDASSNIENYFRSASILNDLKHNYETPDVVKILHDYDFKEIGFDENMETLNVKMMDAINTMHAANFDYENIPDFMDAISTAIPFPTFFMKNFGYWLDIMVNNPELLDNMITVQRGLWSDRDLSEDEFQAEAMGRGAVPTSTFGIPQAADALGGQKLSNLFKGIYKPTPMNSMFSAFNLLNNPVENVAFRLNPIATPLTRHLQEEDSVRYRPYSTNIYERNITPEDENFRELSLLFHRLNPFERQTNTYLRTLPKLEKGQAQLSDFAPSLFQPDF